MKISKYFLVVITILLLSFFKLENVEASTKFTICTSLTENSYLRSTPGGSVIKDVDEKPVYFYKENNSFEILGTVNQNGVDFYKIYTNYYSNNYTGYIKKVWVTDCHDYQTDDNYGNELRNKGFPESYILPLQKLHAVHPNWNFEVSKYGDGLDFSTVVSNEAQPVSKNLIESPDQSLRSTDGAAYNNGNYTQFESGWYAASKQTISFYLDPRNWLDDYSIFMFEQLSYNSKIHTEASVAEVLSGTFLSGTYFYNGSTISYAKTFLDAGIQKNVSPIHLASRVIQEQGVSGDSLTINMQSDGKTYYNYYNINAYGSSSEIIRNNALSTAKRRGWDNPYTAIVDGASTISGNYISQGQDTLYYQKFNTIVNSNSISLYSHQYMANVRAAVSESHKVANSYYKVGKINSSFTFKIPVYTNMPEKTTLSISQNSDNTLSSLSISGCNLTQSFNSSVTNYTCNAQSTANSVTITAKANSSYASVKGDGVIVLSGNNMTTDIIVTALNGDTRTYKININKVESGKESPSDIISSLGFNNSNNMISGISFGTDISNIISDIKSKYVSASIDVKNKNNESKSSGAVATGDKITIQNAGISTTFTAIVKGDANGDGKISISDYAKVKSHILGSSKMDGAYEKAADVNGDGKISISDYAKIKSHILGILKIDK